MLWGHVETGTRLCPGDCQQIAEYQELVNQRVSAVVDEFEKSIIDEQGLRFVNVGEFGFTHELCADGEHLIIAEDKACLNTQKLYNQLMSEPSGENMMMHFNR